MVRKITFSIIILSVFLIVALAITFYLYCYTDFSNWIGLIALWFSGGTLLVLGFDWFFKLLKEPELKIINSGLNIRNEGTKAEFKDLYFTIKNEGGGEALNCGIEAKVEGLWNEYFPLSPFIDFQYFDMFPNRIKKIKLCQVSINDEKIVIDGIKSFPLDWGKIYDMKIKLIGSNFKDKKTYGLKLDFSTWENVKIKLDCSRFQVQSNQIFSET